MRMPLGAKIVALSAASLVALAGCGGSSGGSTAGNSTTPSASASTQNTAQETAAAKTAFQQFFDPTTSLDQRVKLLQNGDQFRAALEAQAKSPLAKSSSVKVNDVTVSGDTATVAYDILLNGKPALANQTGHMVKTSGQWQVSTATFCTLLQMQGGAPAACPSAGASAGATASP